MAVTSSVSLEKRLAPATTPDTAQVVVVLAADCASTPLSLTPSLEATVPPPLTSVFPLGQDTVAFTSVPAFAPGSELTVWPATRTVAGAVAAAVAGAVTALAAGTAAG